MRGSAFKRRLLLVFGLAFTVFLTGCFATKQELEPIKSDISVLEKQFMEVQRDYARARVAAGETGISGNGVNEKLAAADKRISALERRLGAMEAGMTDINQPIQQTAPQLMAPEPVMVEPAQGQTGDMAGAEPQAPEPTKGMVAADEMFNDAQNRYVTGDLGMAEAGFKAFLSKYPNDRLADDARFYLGEVYFDRKEYSRAISEYEGVVKEHPLADRVPDALYKAGVVNVQLNDTAKARDFFMRVMDNYPYSEAAKKARQSLDNLK